MAGARGWASRRPTVELAGRPLISYPIAAARAAGLEPLVVAKAASALPELDCPVVTEPDEPAHPLTGIIAALEHARRADRRDRLRPPAGASRLLIAALAAAGAAGVPADPRPQPLVARYAPALLPRLRAALVMGEPLVKLVAEIGGEAIAGDELRDYGDPEAIFANVNDPTELRRIERLLRPVVALPRFSPPAPQATSSPIRATRLTLASLMAAGDRPGNDASMDPRMHRRVDHDGVADEVAVEEPLEIRVDGEPLAVTMRTPATTRSWRSDSSTARG